MTLKYTHKLVGTKCPEVYLACGQWSAAGRSLKSRKWGEVNCPKCLKYRERFG